MAQERNNQNQGLNENAETRERTNEKQNYQTQEKKSNDTANTPDTFNTGERPAFSFKFNEHNESEESLRRPRSQTYIEAVQILDMLSSTDEEIIEKLREVIDEDSMAEFEGMSIEEIIEEIRMSVQEELASRIIEDDNTIHGIISKCYISGCYVHSITSTGAIMDHYTENGPIPEELVMGRALYKKIKGKCSCIECYTHCCKIIAEDGTVTDVRNKDI